MSEIQFCLACNFPVTSLPFHLLLHSYDKEYFRLSKLKIKSPPIYIFRLAKILIYHYDTVT